VRWIFAGIIVGIASFASAQFTAYHFPQLTGNQTFGGALGMDFDVNQDILITSLGIFDSGQNGIQNNIDCLIYNRITQQVVASKSFGPSNQGLGDGTTNFLDFNTPILLTAGFKGSIVAQGYGVLEHNGNSFLATSTYPTTLNDGGGLITFNGKSRNGNFGAFPTTVDLNVAQYGAGNFKYSALTPVPEPASLGIVGLGLLALRRKKR
jgi:hypothetical protein